MSKNTLRHWGYTQCPECEGRGDWTDDPTPGAYRERCTTCHGTGKVPRELPEGYTVSASPERILLRKQYPICEWVKREHWTRLICCEVTDEDWPAIRMLFDTSPDDFEPAREMTK